MKPIAQALATFLCSLFCAQPLAQALPADNTGSNDFAWDLYNELSGQNENLFFSPYSISSALAMTALGARGNTLDEMSKTLEFPRETSDIHGAFKNIISALHSNSRAFELSAANALWGQAGFSVEKTFLRQVSDYYQADFHSTDFALEPQARAEVNSWVDAQTHGKIPSVIPSGVFNSNTRLVLVNAIYFKGAWQSAFDPQRTRPLPFYVEQDAVVEAPMMNQEGLFPYLETQSFQVIELPYKGNELSLVIFLPRENYGIVSLEKALNARSFAQWQEQSKPTEVVVMIPRLQMSPEFSLGSTLERLGMKSAFNPELADFSGIATPKDALVLSEVIHKAFLELNEVGTEAAAATAVIALARSAIPIKQPPLFKADHPFVFFIRHNATGAILFLGRVKNPLQ